MYKYFLFSLFWISKWFIVWWIELFFCENHATNIDTRIYRKFFTSFLPAIREKAKKHIHKEIEKWHIQLKNDKSLIDIANMFNKKIQGWINYYMHFYPSEIYNVLRYINGKLINWVRRKYKKLNARRRAERWLGHIVRRDRNLFVHWEIGIISLIG